jgi:maltose-binding protein MalE
MKAVWHVVLLAAFLPTTQAGLKAQSTDGATTPSVGVGRELTALLIADAQKTVKPAQAPAVQTAPAGPDIASPDSNAAPDQKAPDVIVPPHEDRVTRFFRTGTLHQFHEKKATADLYAGPCSDGQLLNLKSTW